MTLKICSTNIRFENPADGENDWKNRRFIYAQFLSENQFDIIGTQEGREKQIRDFHSISNLEILTSHRNWIDERMYPTLFINSNRLEAIRTGDFWLSETPNIAGSSSFASAFPRLATWAELKDKTNHHKFFVVNMHLDHVKESTRIRQIEVAIKMILELNSSQLPLIIMGDFNDVPDGVVHQHIKKQLNLIDHWQEKKLPEETSHHSFQGLEYKGYRIDWFFVSSKFICSEIKLDKFQKNGFYLSDHFPLVATFIPNWM